MQITVALSAYLFIGKCRDNSIDYRAEEGEGL